MKQEKTYMTEAELDWLLEHFYEGKDWEHNPMPPYPGDEAEGEVEDAEVEPRP